MQSLKAEQQTKKIYLCTPSRVYLLYTHMKHTKNEINPLKVKNEKKNNLHIQISYDHKRPNSESKRKTACSHDET